MGPVNVVVMFVAVLEKTEAVQPRRSDNHAVHFGKDELHE